MSAAKVTSNISKLMTSLKLMLFTPFPLLSIRKIMKRGSTAYRVIGNASTRKLVPFIEYNTLPNKSIAKYDYDAKNRTNNKVSLLARQTAKRDDLYANHSSCPPKKKRACR